MKFETDTEIDGLLRHQARRAKVSAPSATERAGDHGATTMTAGGAHLDADELNAYAEGVLPEAARARYMTHLADCDECRGLVTKLTLAANVPVAIPAGETPAVVAPSRSWREWLAAFFAPAVLRYAIPAVVLLAVVAVAFIATRERRQDNSVAQNETQQSKGDATQTNPTATAAPTVTANTATTPAVNDSIANSNAIPEATPTAGKTGMTAPEQPKKEGANEQEAVAKQNEPKPVDQQPVIDGVIERRTDARTESKTVAKAQPPPAPTTPAANAPGEDSNYSREELARQRDDDAEKTKNTVPQSSAGSASGGLADSTQNRALGAARPATVNGRRENPARKSRPADSPSSSDRVASDDKDESATATRSAGGRQFRRQGGAWVDTAYSSARATTNVARGSEQYRALVADEPGIASIANQLGGTVVVVWKGRAYRIY